EFNELDEDLGWHDFTLRSYDPQIGRFLQADPYDQFASGYVGMGNDPVNGVDPSGGFVSPTGLLDVVVTAGQSAMQVVNKVVSIASSVFSAFGIYSSVSSGSSDVFKKEGKEFIDTSLEEVVIEGKKSAGNSYKSVIDKMNSLDPKRRALADLFKNYKESGEIRQYKPNWVDKWSKSDNNIVAKITYEAVNSPYLFLQAVTPWIGHTNAINLNGEAATITQIQDGGVGTLLMMAPLAGNGLRVGTTITKNSIIHGYKVSNHAWRKSGLGRGATEEMVSEVIIGARNAGTVVIETGTGKFAGNVIKVYDHNGIKVVVDETRELILSIRPESGFTLP
ncbi:RHS repeat-associated core domain-containing protein, partial [Polluticaenibacter yanchengensis]|nr:RHS repeat-associated core domain-containing protein [Chitinophagaceae bacterium LY-5]